MSDVFDALAHPVRRNILKLLDTLGSKVWVARRIDIARFWMEQFPGAGKS